jgi:hypothetical protein
MLLFLSNLGLVHVFTKMMEPFYCCSKILNLQGITKKTAKIYNWIV